MVKRLFIIKYLILYVFTVFCQTNNLDNHTITYISEAPYYIGGMDSMKRFITKNLQYPESAIQDKIEGTVIVEFWIDTNGMTTDHKVIRSVRNDLDKEAIRVSKLITFSQSAKQRDNAIKVPYSIPFKFELPKAIAISQNNCDTVSIVFGSPEKFPEFDINKFIVMNLKYPETAKKDNIEGIVTVRFWIDTNGYTSEHEIVKGIREDLDKEVLRVVRLIKFDKPPMNREEPIGMCFQFPVSFRLSEKAKPLRKIRKK
jgi:TonB family protein